MSPENWSWHTMVLDIFRPAGSLLEIVIRCTIVYLFLVVGLRLAGKREMGQMTITDLVLVLVISNAVQNAMIGPDTSLTGGLIGALILLVCNAGITRLERSNRTLRKLILGTPTLLVHDGALIREHMKTEGIMPDQIMEALREHGIDHLDHVKSAVLETDGSISIIASEQPVTHKRKQVRYLRHSEM